MRKSHEMLRGYQQKKPAKCSVREVHESMKINLNIIKT
jgi:hypothetical protein